MLEFRNLLRMVACTGLLALIAQAQISGPTPAPGSDPEAYVKLGVEDGAKGDLSGALAAFTTAITINPQWAPAYEKRGCVLLQQNKFDDAVADFSHAIGLDPTYQDALYYRGIAEGGQTQFDAAINDFSRLIQINPGDARAYASRGFARYFKGDFDGAIADTTRALAYDPHLPASYFTRGLAQRNKQDRADQIADFQKSAEGGFAYGAFWLWIAKMETGDAASAQSSLTDFFNKYPGAVGGWTGHVGDFLLGKMKPDDLRSIAVSDDPALGHIGEAWFFIGINQRVRGDLNGAQASFAQAVANGTKQSVEYAEAQHELATLPKN